MFRITPTLRRFLSRSGKIRFSLLGLLVLITLICVGLGWAVRSKPYLAETYLSIKSPSEATDRQQQVFRATQKALVASEFVLNNALSRSQIAQLDCVIKQQPHELSWLRNELEVSFPGDSEIMVVSLRGKDSEMDELCTLLDAVIQSYTNEVVFKSRVERNEVMEGKQKKLRQLQEELEEKVDRFSSLQRELEPQEGEIPGKMILLKQEIEILKLLTSELQIAIRRTEIEEDVESERIRVLQAARWARE